VHLAKDAGEERVDLLSGPHFEDTLGDVVAEDVLHEALARSAPRIVLSLTLGSHVTMFQQGEFVMDDLVEDGQSN